MGYFSDGTLQEDASVPGGMNQTFEVKNVDNKFWDIFEFDFIGGKPYTKAENDAAMKVAVLTEKAARTLFESTDVVGKEFLLKQIPYRVVGVIKDVNPLFTLSYSEIYIPMDYNGRHGEHWTSEYVGDVNVLLVKKKGVSDEQVKEQVRKRYESLHAILQKEGRDVTYHESPYNMEVLATSHGSNTTPTLPTTAPCGGSSMALCF